MIYVHAITQLIGYSLAIAGFAQGLWLATTLNKVHTVHATMGLVVSILGALQPILGFVQAALVRRGRPRSTFCYFHAYFGRAMIIFGIVTGGLGLQLAAPYERAVIWKAEVGYAITTGVIAGAYFAILLVTAYTRRRGIVEIVDEAQRRTVRESVGLQPPRRRPDSKRSSTRHLIRSMGSRSQEGSRSHDGIVLNEVQT